MKGKLAIVLILLILPLLIGCGGGSELSSPLNVSNSENESSGPCLAVDSTGTLHLAWYDYTPGNNDIFYSSKPANGSFSKDINISENSGQSRSPALVAGEGSSYLFWSDYTPGEYHILFATMSEDGSWSETEDLLPESEGCENPSAVVDNKGNIHLVWQEELSYDDRILYATNAAHITPTPTPTPTPTAAPTPTPVPVPTMTPLPITPPVTMKNYSNDYFGYAIAYPDTWQIDDYYYPQFIQIAPEVGLTVVLIEARDLEEESTLESFYSGALDELRENSSYFEIDSTTEVRTGEALPGIEVAITISSTATPELKFKQKMLYMLRDRQGFVVAVSSFIDTWEGYVPVFDSVLQSFNLSINQPAPAPTPTPTPGPTPAPTPAPVIPVAEGWSSPQILSQNDGESREPALTIDSNNTLHLAWSSDAPGNWDVFYQAKTAVGEWSTPVNLSDNAGESRAPAIAVDSRGTVHLAWHDYGSGNYEIMYTSLPEGGSWTTPHNISSNSGSSGVASLAIDSNDKIHLVWNDSSSGTWEILYATKPVDGAWTKAINVSSTEGDSAVPVIAIDVEGNVHLAWQEDSSGNWEIFYRLYGE
ncbi:hypothetical protein ACFLWV_02770 [Chloroflexota bacterium]